MRLKDVDLKARGFKDVNFVSKAILTDNYMNLCIRITWKILFVLMPQSCKICLPKALRGPI